VVEFRILKYEFRILKYDFRILKYEFRILKYEFRILKYDFGRKICGPVYNRKLVKLFALCSGALFCGQGPGSCIDDHFLLLFTFMFGFILLFFRA